MDGILIPLIFLLVALLIVVGVQLVVAFGIGAVALFYIGQPGAMSSVGLSATDGLNSFTLIAIPLFIITGDLIVATGVARKLFDLVDTLMSWAPGGVGLSSQGACGLFAAISGSNVAGAAAVGRVTTPELLQRDYPKDYAGGMVASAAITGILIPPSISYIILAMTMQLSVAQLFIATIIPGLVILGLMMILHLVLARRKSIDQETSSLDVRGIVPGFWRAKYGLMVPVIILGGIYAGIFTATESAAAAIGFMIIVGFATRQFTPSDYTESIIRSGALNGIISPLVAIFVLFSQAIGFWHIPERVTETLLSLGGGSTILTVGIVLLILILSGTVISTIPNILLLSPLLIPVGTSLGFDVIHFSIFFLCGLALGFITPPVGLNLFVLAGLVDEPVESVAIQALPFFFIALFGVILVIAFPQLSLILL